VQRKSGLTVTNVGGSVYVFKWNNKEYAVSSEGIIQNWDAQKNNVTGRPLTGKANGGLIKGPGTGTSDSIRASLNYANGGHINVSNGEYIQRASAVSKYGVDFMNAINSGRYDAGSSSITNNVNVTVNADGSAGDYGRMADIVAKKVMSTLSVMSSKNNKSNRVDT
jgi:hypothetical protein